MIGPGTAAAPRRADDVTAALTAAQQGIQQALEAQQAAMSAFNLPSAGDVERLERRVRSLSQRLEEVEDQVDRVARDVSEIRRQIAAEKRGED